jgi:acetate kinase
MRTLLEQRSANPRAALAVEMFCYQVRKFAGAFAAALRGLDTLVFTGGIGERAAPVRAEICDGLEFLGLRVDAARNARHEPVISGDNSGCVVRVVQTDEDLMIARHTWQLLDPSRNQYTSKAL